MQPAALPPQAFLFVISHRSVQISDGSPLSLIHTKHITMKLKWYNYVACFFAGLFLANVVPHFVNGVSGNSFPTPFADPPGEGLSSPTVNVLWALFNLVAGYLLFRAGKVKESKIGLVIFFIGIAAISLMLSNHFGKVH
jgi:hypothetical protein